MNISKMNNLLNKKNDKLEQELKNIKSEAELDKFLAAQDYEYCKKLICDLEEIKDEWNKSLNEIKEEKQQYSILITELKELKKTIIKGDKIPFYKKYMIKKYK